MTTYMPRIYPTLVAASFAQLYKTGLRLKTVKAAE